MSGWVDVPKPDVAVVKAVRLLRVQPGDIVVFHSDELMTEQEMDHFRRTTGARLRERHPDVQFMIADRISDITVVRPERGLQGIRLPDGPPYPPYTQGDPIAREHEALLQREQRTTRQGLDIKEEGKADGQR